MIDFGVVQSHQNPFRLALCLLILCLATAIATSQTLPNITAGDQLGELPYVSYHGGDIDAVSLTNGGLSLHIPLLAYPQRGALRMSFSLKYNNMNQHYGPLCLAPDPCELDWVAANTSAPVSEKSDVFAVFDQGLGVWATQPYPRTWKVGGQTYTDNYADYYVTSPDGSKHILGNFGTAQLVPWPSSNSPDSYLVSNGPWETLDATGIKVTGALAPISALWNPTSPTIIASDGVAHVVSGTSDAIQDTNGNFISLTGSGYTDSLGRTIPYPPNQRSASNTSTSVCPSGPLTVTKAVAWNVPAVGGGTATYTFCYVTVTPNMPPSMTLSNQTVYGQVAPSTNLQSIVLPNGVAWKFEYNDQDATLTYNGQPVTYGTLSKITLPTGGSVSYTWTNAGASLAANNPSFCNTGGRWISARTVTDLDNVARTWTYVYEVPLGSYAGTVVTDPLGNDTAHVFGIGNGFGGGCEAYETQTLYYQGSYSSGTLLRTVNTTYQSTSTGNTFPNPVLNVVPITIQTIEANNQTTETTKSYDSGFTYLDHFGVNSASGIYGKMLTEQVYDYGSSPHGALLRTTNTSYVWQSPNPNYATYLSNNLLNFPYSVQVKDGGGTQRAYTYYGYDEATPQSSGITEQKTTGETYPGNQTSVHRWLNGSTTGTTNCNAVTNGYLVTTKAHYDTGEVPTVTDPCGYQTNYQYSGTYYGAFVTKVTNALGQNMFFGYDFNTGGVTSITDWNSQVTTENYDILTRPISVNYPDGGSTTVCYTDSGGSTCAQGVPPYAVVKTKAITSSLNETSTVIFDGLGRPSQTQLNSDPSGTTYTLTTYDALSRKSQVYNPTRCASITTNCNSETTWGYTTTNYDPLNRVTSVVEQDGSTVSTNYSAFPCTTVTDEAGNSRQSCVDGLGRMTSVLEDPGSSPHLNYTTNYTYDVLGNLTYVNQIGSSGGTPRTRTFQYDSLSELTSAQNPESGAITYAYDADGNVVTKTAPLSNQTGTATVTTTNTYDKLNRLIKKSYMDGNNADPYTPTVQFGYDGVAISGCTILPPGDTDTYPVGRSTAMCDGSGATSWIHDKMGRVSQERRAIGAQTVNHYVNYTFNLDGSLKVLQTPPMKNLNYTYSGAARPTQLVDSTDNINFALSATYAPPGELAGATLGYVSGGFAGFTVSNAYNDRLQPILLSAASPTAAVFSECFDFHLGVAITSPCSFFRSTAGDNGNVYQIVNNRDGNRTQNFTYDPLNRIQQAYTNGPNWGETFSPTATSPGVAPSTSGIDAWGNLTNRSGVTGKTYNEPLNCPANTNNQLTTCSMAYDAAGNMTANGTATYVYDAENRLLWTNGTPASRYIYDGQGERVEKCQAATATTACPTSGSTGTLYWRGTGSDTLAETDLAGNDEEEYLFFNGERIARRDTTSTGTTIAIHYYFSDHLGSHGVVENATGTTCEQDIDYYPYGGVQNDYCSGSGVAQNYKFNGKERDAESGLDNFGARYDSSALGRFMTPDWAAKPVTVPYAKFGDPQSLNLYSYVENGPVNRIDADGHVEWAPQIDFGSGQIVNIGAATAEAAGAGGSIEGMLGSNLTCSDCNGPVTYPAQKPSQQQSNRQSDGSYKATPAQLAQIKDAADKKTTIGNGQCVTACERFTGVPGPTSLWEGGKPASELTDKDKGTAIATFVKGPDGKWRYLPDANGHMNSGTFMGTSTKGTFWMADQWPQGKPVSIWNVGSNPNNASMNAASYRVIVVPNP